MISEQVINYYTPTNSCVRSSQQIVNSKLQQILLLIIVTANTALPDEDVKGGEPGRTELFTYQMKTSRAVSQDGQSCSLTR